LNYIASLLKKSINIFKKKIENLIDPRRFNNGVCSGYEAGIVCAWLAHFQLWGLRLVLLLRHRERLNASAVICITENLTQIWWKH